MIKIASDYYFFSNDLKFICFIIWPGFLDKLFEII